MTKTTSSILITDRPPKEPMTMTDGSFQKRVLAWMMECFSMEICRDGQERNHRFLEEALELVQSLDCTRSEAHQLVDYTFDRPAGDPKQELGGVMVTIAALCFPNELDMSAAAEAELARVWSKIDVLRAKQAARPKHSALAAPPPPAGEEIEWLKSSLVSLLTLAEAKPSPLTNEQVASICRVTLNKYTTAPFLSPPQARVRKEG